MRLGQSFKAFAGLIGVHRDTLYNWVDTFPEFEEAKQIGESASEYTWEKRASLASLGELPGLNVGVFAMTMKNRFNWKDKHHLEMSGKGGQPLIPSKPITPEELKAALAMDAFTIDVTPEAKDLPPAPEDPTKKTE